MPNYIRPQLTGCTVFFTVNSYQRRPILIDPDFRFTLRKAIQKTRINHPFDINAWVLLPDNLHCTWTLPPGDKEISARWSMIKRFVTQGIEAQPQTQKNICGSRKKRGESTIWQRRFWEHHILSDTDYMTHVNYCYWNPVKHGLVQSVKEWEYSTFHRDVKRNIFPVDWYSNDESDDVGKYGETVRTVHPTVFE